MNLPRTHATKYLLGIRNYPAKAKKIHPKIKKEFDGY